MPWWATTSAPALGKGDLMHPAWAVAGDHCLQSGVPAGCSAPARATLTQRCDNPGDEGAGDILLPSPCSCSERRWVLDSSGHIGLCPSLPLEKMLEVPRDAPELQVTKLSLG